MNNESSYILGVIFIGVGASMAMDLWNMFLRRAFKIKSLNYCLLGRWLLYMPAGTFWHTSISTSLKKSFECMVGWFAHYTIGVAFALVFVIIAPADWTVRPTLLPVLLYGIATVVFPFFIMQPSLGLGIASSRTSNPILARLKSIMTHTVFGIGLYICTLAFNYILRVYG